MIQRKEPEGVNSLSGSHSEVSRFAKPTHNHMVSNFVDAPHTYNSELDNMVVSKTMPRRYKNGRAEVPRSVKYNFCYPYFLYHIRDGRFGNMEEFIFHNLTLEKAFRLALKMEAENDPLFIEVAKWRGYKVDEEATA